MKQNVSGPLLAFLNDLCTSGLGGSYGIIDLFTVQLLSGVVLRWASWPVSVVLAGHTYSGVSPYVERSRLVQSLKLEVSQIKITIKANPLMTVGSTPILAAIAAGMFAGATVSVDRLFAPTVNPLDTSLGTLNWFTGAVAEIEDLDRSSAVLVAKDPTAFLSTDYPRNLYLTGCRHTFGDAGCTVNKAALAVPGAVQAGSTSTVIKTNLTASGGIGAPASAPALSDTGHLTSVALASQTYFVVVTFTGAAGESAPSAESSHPITGSLIPNAGGTTDKHLIVAAPGSPPTGATGWKVYVGLAAGQEQLQATFTGFSGGSATWTQIGVLAQGPPPPTLPTGGAFTLGIITFNDAAHGGGANASVSQVISDYSVVGGFGVVTTTPPLPSTPAAGDKFQCVPDCDKTMAQCTAYGNISHYGGTPFLPLPEQSI